MRTNFRIKLRGIKWLLRFRPPHVFSMSLVKGRRHRHCGEINWDSHEISIRDNMPPVLTLDTLLHEMCHACFPDTDEEAIDTAATSMANVLWRVYFKDKDKDKDNDRS